MVSEDSPFRGAGSGPCEALERFEAQESFFIAFAAPVLLGREAEADRGALGLAEEQAAVVRAQLHAAGVGRLAGGHAGNGRGDRGDDATSGAARTAIHLSEYTVCRVSRNLTIDAYRGFVMLLMMAEVLRLPALARQYPGNPLLDFLAFHQSHVAWEGCSLHDMIQPSFSFLVGVALPYSLASRVASGASFGKLFSHTLWRSLVLVAMGIFLRSTHSKQTNFTFEDTLTQIGLGYPFLFLLGRAKARTQWIVLAIILAGYGAAWALYPLPGQPWLAHWAKGDNLLVAFDAWFLNLFPRPEPWVIHRGGYGTLSFIPTLGTMILGLIAGQLLREQTPQRRYLELAGMLLAGGLFLHFAGIMPIVKRIWTPAWTLAAGGGCFLFLAGFRYLLEVRGWTRWAFPLVVVGMNSIAAYWIAHVLEDPIADSLRIHLGAAFASGPVVLALEWVLLYWMYRRRLFLKV
jgi:heparan-alpha-glucosaminide N-acetyltransferase